MPWPGLISAPTLTHGHRGLLLGPVSGTHPKATVVVTVTKAAAPASRMRTGEADSPLAPESQAADPLKNGGDAAGCGDPGGGGGACGGGGGACGGEGSAARGGGWEKDCQRGLRETQGRTRRGPAVRTSLIGLLLVPGGGGASGCRLGCADSSSDPRMDPTG
ncbi:uncharacterized protein LOC134809106 isoform X1 [Pan troglodytes]|uniref:uncharacterized protein LOC134809106 isoform X1 n=1 Tax=Pan troglodytes TaxID=9598 RepID=UPI0030136D55